MFLALSVAGLAWGVVFFAAGAFGIWYWNSHRTDASGAHVSRAQRSVLLFAATIMTLIGFGISIASLFADR